MSEGPFLWLYTDLRGDSGRRTTQSGLFYLLMAKTPTAGSEENAESQPLQHGTMRIRPGQRMAIGT